MHRKIHKIFLLWQHHGNATSLKISGNVLNWKRKGRGAAPGTVGAVSTVPDFFSKKKFFLKVFLDFKNNAYKYAILKTGLKNKTLCSDE